MTLEAAKASIDMHVIVSTHGKHRWLSGIFLRADEAQACLASIPKQSDCGHLLQSIQQTTFPLYIVQDHLGFHFLDAADVVPLITAITDQQPDAEPILFTILSEYQPSIPGRDEMGALRHTHLDQPRVAELRRSGLSCL